MKIQNKLYRTWLPNKISSAKILALSLGFLALSGCLNLFSPFDAPTGDIQLLSAARAAFDRGDYAEAAKYYTQLSSSYNDTAIAEKAFLVMDENGAGMGNFMKANVSANGSAGGLLTQLAESMASGAGQTKRIAVWQQLQNVQTISDKVSRGFAEFITGFSFAAELLAEVAESDGVLYQRDIVLTPASCNTAGCPITPPAACAPPSPANALIQGAAYTLTTMPTGQPTLYELNEAFNFLIGTAIPDLGISSGLSAGLQAIFNVGPAVENCYRGTMMLEGIGQ